MYVRSLGSLFLALYSVVLAAHSFNTLNSGSSSSSANLQSVGMSDLEVKLNEVEEEYRAGIMALLITKLSGILSYIVFSSTRRAD